MQIRVDTLGRQSVVSSDLTDSREDNDSLLTSDQDVSS